jgi:hypothetical protein
VKIVYAFSPPFAHYHRGRPGNYGGNQQRRAGFAVYGFGLSETGKLDGSAQKSFEGGDARRRRIIRFLRGKRS